MAEDGRLRKQEADYTKEVDDALPVATTVANDGKLRDAIESLLPLEKKSRVATDMKSTSRVLVHIMVLCYDQKDWDMMGEYLILLTKRRGQLKKPVTDMVQKVCEYIETIDDRETLLKMIDVVRTVTSGKIHVEVERARITMKLAKIKEEEGDIAAAADVLQELQVETFGSMEKKEKVEFILEQMRLCLAKKDFIRAQIISKKISTRFFADESTDDLKLKYYNLMLELSANDKDYLASCKYHRAIFDTKSVQDHEDDWKTQLAFSAVFICLAPYDNEQSDLIERIKLEKKLEELPELKELLNLLTTTEIYPWRMLEAQFGPYLKELTIFKDSYGESRWSALKVRLVEHNIRVIAQYYRRITMARLAELLELTQDDAEQHVSSLVTKKTITAKIDRPAGVISFEIKKSANAILNDWSHNISDLVSLVDKTTHMINKDRMQHKV